MKNLIFYQLLNNDTPHFYIQCLFSDSNNLHKVEKDLKEIKGAFVKKINHTIEKYHRKGMQDSFEEPPTLDQERVYILGHNLFPTS